MPPISEEKLGSKSVNQGSLNKKPVTYTHEELKKMSKDELLNVIDELQGK